MVAYFRFFIISSITLNGLVDARIVIFQESLIPSYVKSMQVLVPGTKWCGEGNRAKNDNDLGYFHTTDVCCREHDHCPYVINEGDKKYGLENKSFFTRLHCECDQKFYKCLKNSGHFMSNRVGYLYFTVIRPTCFEFKEPCNTTTTSENSVDCNIVEGDWKENRSF